MDWTPTLTLDVAEQVAAEDECAQFGKVAASLARFHAALLNVFPGAIAQAILLQYSGAMMQRVFDGECEA
jgi:hypothetical protein